MSKMIRFHNFGKDVLKAEDLEISQPDVRALLVSVHAASVNPVDFKIRCKAWSMAGKEKRSSISSNSRQESASSINDETTVGRLRSFADELRMKLQRLMHRPQITARNFQQAPLGLAPRNTQAEAGLASGP